MVNIEGKNFTDFRNVNLRGDAYQGGTPGGALGGGVIRFTAGQTFGGVVGGASGWDSTVAMAIISGSNNASINGSVEVPYLSIANAGLNIGTGYIRYVPVGGTTSGTISVNNTYNDSDRAWQLPNKSGVIGITGTFAANLQAVSATSFTWSTLVTVTGIRQEDGLVVTQSNQGVSAGYNTFTTAKIFQAAVPGNGNITLNFVNLGATTGYTEAVFSYTAVR